MAYIVVYEDQPMRNYVISLSNESQRRKHIHTEFTKKGLVFEFFDAITPITLSSTALDLGITVDKTDLHPNEISCILSHVCLWKKAVDEKLDSLEYDSVSRFIGSTISWSKTKEGIDFWRKKEQEIEKIENSEENKYDQRRKN